jgi:large subunit ribosomal protein L10
MTREEKSIAIEDLTAQLAGTNILRSRYFWVKCRYNFKVEKSFLKAGIKLEVIKNTLLVKAMELLVMIMVSCHRF